MKDVHYRIQVKEWIENSISINGGFKFSKYKANKYKEAVRVYCIRNYKDLEERRVVYFKYIEKIDDQTIKNNEF